MGLTFSNYVLQPFFNDCAVPTEATQLLAAATICRLLVFDQFYYLNQKCLIFTNHICYRPSDICQLL